MRRNTPVCIAALHGSWSFKQNRRRRADGATVTGLITGKLSDHCNRKENGGERTGDDSGPGPAFPSQRGLL